MACRASATCASNTFCAGRVVKSAAFAPEAISAGVGTVTADGRFVRAIETWTDAEVNSWRPEAVRAGEATFVSAAPCGVFSRVPLRSPVFCRQHPIAADRARTMRAQSHGLRRTLYFPPGHTPGFSHRIRRLPKF